MTAATDVSTSAFVVEVVDTGAERALVVRFACQHDVLSWALVNGGRRLANAVVWREVRPGELGAADDAGALLEAALVRLASPAAVGLLTARDVRRHDIECVESEGVVAECLATVGLGNLLAVGDPTAPAGTRVGTINLLCRVSVGLTDEALLEASALAAEARTAAILAAALRSPLTGRPATGTGTDCIVVAAPAQAPRHRFAGKHTACGSAIGGAVFGAVARGTARWLKENRCPA
jgi:adenosylcobinamide amidohydrolase